MPRPLPLFLLLSLLFFCTPQPSEEQSTRSASFSATQLRELMEQLQQEPGLRHALLGAYVVEAGAPDTARVLLDYHSQWSMATASTLKVVTTAAALALLGPDFSFETQLAHSGQVGPDGALQGDLYVLGGGDPTLGIDGLEALLQTWADALKKAGIKRIDGQIVGDARLFEADLLPRTWIWEDIGNYYGSGSCGLNIHENYYELFCKTGKPGTSAELLGTAPEVAGLRLTNELLAGPAGSGDEGYIFGAPFAYERRVRGSIPPNQARFVLKGSLPDPALQCAQWLAAHLAKQGVPSQGAKALYEGGETPALTVLHRTRSPKLSGIVAKTNTKSINLYAEAMLKMVGKQQLGEGSTAKGIEAVAAHWQQAGLDMEGFVMEDGSGLSRFNAVTPRQLAEILRTARTAPWFGDLEASLAVAGETGTLRNLCKGQAAAGRIVGKSGYINRVRCYVGYARTYQGRTLAFAIMANNFTGPYRGLTPAFERFFNTLVQVSW